MAEYNKKWANLFPATIGNQTRPSAGVDNTLQYETDKFPQHIANDPVRYDKMNAVVSQSMSNDERLNEKIKRTSDDLAAHNKDPKAHATGISGNAGSATKLVTARTIQTNLASTSAASFNGTTNIAPGVTGTLPVGNGGTGQTNLDNVTVGTSKKVHTIVSSGTVGELVKATMGNDDSFRIAVGGGSNNGYAEIATADDGTEPIYVRQYANGKADNFITPTRTATLLDAGGNTSFPGKVTAPTFVGNLNGNADRATKATQDASGNVIANTYVRHYQSIGETDLNNLKLGGLYANPLNANATAERHYPEVNHAGSIFVINNGANGDDGCTQVYTTFDSHNSYKREYDVNSKTWSAWRRYAFEDSTVANAQKLSTARKINITGNATGSASFDGSRDVSINITVNESKHAAAADTLKSSPATETSTVARPVWLSWEGDNTKQTVSSNLTYTCSTKTLTAANFKGHLAGNADTATNASHATNADKANTANAATNANHASNADSATNADKVDGYHENSFLRFRGAAAATGEDTLWNQIGIKEYGEKLPKGVSGTYNYGAVVSLPGKNTRLDIWYNHQCSANKDGLWYRLGYGSDQKTWARLLDSNNYTNWAPTKTGAGASGTWGINISGNAASATNADKVDGYHASDLLRILGGNRTPVITDIFDRAGTIDMSTMSAEKKATHKANINKAPNMTQNIWNNATGIHAYGGDTNISGFPPSTLKLTQSWRNFDKLMILYTDDDGNWGRVRTFDVYEFNYCMTNMHSFNILFANGQSWHVYGLTKHGTDSDFKPSTETILSCRSQNCGIIGIYGIKF